MVGSRLFKYASLFVLPVFFVIFVPSVLAVGKPSGVGGKPDDVNGSPSSVPRQTQSRLSDTKLKVCQTRENTIRTRSRHLIQLATTMQEKFGAIAERVKDYYTTKILPEYSIANYDALIADIAAKKTTVETALTQTQNDATSFSCDENDPKGLVTQYRKNMQSTVQALKNYRTSIKNLIVAVRTSPSPKP